MLPLVVLIVLLMMIIGLGVSGLGLHSRLFAIRSADSITARAAADAAIADAIFKMNEKLRVKPWDNSSFPAASDVALLDSDATYDYVVTKNADGNYVVDGTGKSLNHVHTINGTLRLASFFEYALFAKDSIELKNTAAKSIGLTIRPAIRRFRSAQPVPRRGAITLMNGSVINGEVMVGIGGDPDVVIEGKSTAKITGGTDSFTYIPPLPSVIVPDYVASMASGGQITKSITISDSGKYSSINLGNGKELTIDKPVTLYITGDVLFGNAAGIKIESGGSLTLYVGGNVIGNYSAGFNNATADSRNLSIYCLDTCTKVLFKNSGDFYGTIYAPNAAVGIDNSANIYGSIVSTSFILKNSGKLLYDVNLRDRTVNDEGVRFAIKRWSEN